MAESILQTLRVGCQLAEWASYQFTRRVENMTTAKAAKSPAEPGTRA